MDQYKCIDLRGPVTMQNMWKSARSGRVSVAVWGWISSRGTRLLHRTDGRLNGAQYLHILRYIMVPSVREMFPDGVINFQQDQSPVHKLQLFQGWLLDQNEVELLDWPPCGTNLNPIENVWSETKTRHGQKLAWPIPSFYESPMGCCSERLRRGGP
jgi:hypothetical protein